MGNEGSVCLCVTQKDRKMKPNVWNIKEILNIPSTSMSKSVRGGKTSDHCNLSDSQFLFGSQFWPENSQDFSQEMSGLSRGSQSASQEINELKVSTSYHSKPFLFGDGKSTNISSGKTKGILDRFEEDKRKAKENEILIHGLRQLHDSLENIRRTFLNFVDGSCEITKHAVTEGLDGLRKTIQDDLANIKENIASQTEILVGLQNQTNREIKDSEAKTTTAVKDLSSHMLSLQRDLESLRIEQSKEQRVFGEIQSLLGTVIATHSAGACPRPVRMTDNTAQTSPGLIGKCCVISGEMRCGEGMRMCSGPITHSEERGHWDVCHIKAKTPEKLNIGAYFPALNSVSAEKQKHLFSSTAADKSYSTQRATATALNHAVGSTSTLQRSYVARTPAQIQAEPVKPLANVEGKMCTTWPEVRRQDTIPKRGQKSHHFRRKKRALILPQRRPNERMASVNIYEDRQYDEEKENRAPLSSNQSFSKKYLPSSQQKGTDGLKNRHDCGQNLNSCLWSQSSNSSEMMVEYKRAEQETMMPRHKTDTTVRQRGIWQLFDFINDSD